ncbi:MAG TPA: methyltransferase [Egibacteraceae bacterium]
MTEPTGAFARATGRSAEAPSGRQVNYRRWQLEQIAPHCGASVLEVGAGLGEFAAQLRGRERLVLTDVDPLAVEAMVRRFADRPEVEVRQLDVDGDLVLEEPVDTVIAINVLEHIPDDVGALRRLAGFARPGGRVVLWVPGHMALYGDFDRKVGHVRRYSPALLRQTATYAGLQVEVCRPVNLLGALAWWAAVRVGGTGSPKPVLVELYDRVVVPLTRAIERVVRPPFGQSVLCVARVPAALAHSGSRKGAP